MRNIEKCQVGVPLTGRLNEAVLKGCIRPIEINDDWVSYRHPEHSLNSASLHEGRFNHSGQTAYYIASGDHCGQREVPNHRERVRCSVKKGTINVFDLPALAACYNYDESFVKQREGGGWDICQEVSTYLTTNHQVSGILYQSAACHKNGQQGICLAVLPGKGQNLPEDFFLAKTDSAEMLDVDQAAVAPKLKTEGE